MLQKACLIKVKVLQNPSVSKRVGVCMCMNVCLSTCVCLAIEVTWEDQQRGLNGSLSDGVTQPHPSLTDTGWLV